jgi:L-amino acid N-acyltransferase YncA
MEYKITPMKPEDWPTVREIYREGIATGNATFEIDLPAWEKWDAAHRKDCRLLARNAEQIFGWAALSPVSARRVYSGIAEVSVYVAAPARGIGVGKMLLRALIEESERNEIWTCKPESFPKTSPASRCTNPMASVKSVSGGGSAN